MSIDKQAREYALDILIKFLKREISSDGFDDLWPMNSYDRVLEKIFNQISNMYDDNENFYMNIGILKFESKRRILMCILFLRGDIKYTWPEFPDEEKFRLRDLFHSKRSSAKLWRNFIAFGEVKYWPFVSREQMIRVWRVNGLPVPAKGQ